MLRNSKQNIQETWEKEERNRGFHNPGTDHLKRCTSSSFKYGGVRDSAWLNNEPVIYKCIIWNAETYLTLHTEVI